MNRSRPGSGDRGRAALGAVVLLAAVVAIAVGSACREAAVPAPRPHDAVAAADAGAAGRGAAPRDAGPLELRELSTCEATPVPKDAGFWDDDGGALASARFEVPYGADVKQTYDVARPDGPDPAPLVVLVHGGGWTAGDKHLFWPTMRALVDHGFVAASVNYRLARDEARAHPVGARDVRCAVAHLVRHAAELRADPARVALVGASAGGHLAALVAAAPDLPELSAGCEDVRVRVAGVVSYYAPLDLEAERGYPPKMHAAVAELLRLDAGTPEWVAAARRASPASWLDDGDPPFLLLHGTADRVVPVDDSRSFKRALDAHHVPSLLVEVPDRDHGFAVLSRKPELLPATCTAWAFLDRVLAR